MTETKIVNIVNFIRSEELRVDIPDLCTTVGSEIALNKKYGFDNTFLIMYDAMLKPEYRDQLLNARDEHMEIGMWIEIPQDLTKAVGLKWNGPARQNWDWHVNPGYLMAYTPDERKLLIDEAFSKFKEIFGHYPHSVGAWLIDCISMDYMTEKYGVDAFCICREQWGTDGYFLWGGYYNQGYYASKKNMLIPAQNKENQIASPVFRMLGIDPIHAYDHELTKDDTFSYGCRTLEPVWPTGFTEDWCRWYFENMLREDLGFSNTQTGQENSFGFSNFKAGLEMQLEMIDKYVKEGKLCVKKLCDTGTWFKKTFPETPATAYSGLGGFRGRDVQSLWYDSKFYRANLFCDSGKVWFRDINLFDEGYTERYYHDVETSFDGFYDALAMVDGFLWSDETTRAGLYFDKEGTLGETHKDGDALIAEVSFTDGSALTVRFTEKQFVLKGTSPFALSMLHAAGKETNIRSVGENAVHFAHNGMTYTLHITKGKVTKENDFTLISDENNELVAVIG